MMKPSPKHPKFDHKEWGYLYLLQMTASDFYKVGRTRKVDNRIKVLQTGCPTRIRCVRRVYLKNPAKWETIVHRALKDFRTTGEWFHLPPWRLQQLMAGLDRLEKEYGYVAFMAEQRERKIKEAEKRAEAHWARQECIDRMIRKRRCPS